MRLAPSQWRSRLVGSGLVVAAVAAAAAAAVWMVPGLGQDLSQRPSGVESASAPTGGEERPRRSDPGAERPAPLLPVRLEIPAIGVSTPLIRLGVMPDRTVEVPGDADRAGWFHHGTAPGQEGSAVILGHVDSTAGPAVFARLRELRPGDLVSVARHDGSTVRFAVRSSVLYANADFPGQRVYGAQGARRLNLVTCGGVYDSSRGGYQSNLVVYTRRLPDALPE